MNRCIQCNNITKNPKFCSRSCSVSYNNNLNPKRKRKNTIKSYCLSCNLELLSPKQKKYCNQKCQNKYQYDNYINRWLDGKETGYVGKCYQITSHVKKWMYEKHGTKCSKCGWDEKHPKDGKILTQIDHIDGDASNSKPNNLRILCPNCHTMTDTYGGRNKNSPREKYTKIFITPS